MARSKVPVYLPGMPTDQWHAAPKGYIDDAMAAHLVATDPHNTSGGYAAGLIPSDQGATPSVIHNLGTQDLVVGVREVATGLLVRVATETLDDDTVRFSFSTAPTSGQYRYVLLSAAALPGGGGGAHTHPESDVTGLVADLAGKAALSHTHAIADVTSLQATLDGKAGLSHVHSTDDVISGTFPISRIPTGTTSTTVAVGNDSRFSDARTPTAHASSHASGGSDPITPAAIGAAASSHTHAGADIASGTVAYARLPVGTAASTVAAGDDSRITGAVPNTRTLSAGTGLTGGGDLTANRSFAVAYGSASGTAVQGNDARVVADQAAGTASIRTIGTGALQAAAGNHSHSAVLVPFAPVALSDGASIATNASLGNHFRSTLTTDPTLANPTAGTDGQRVLWELAAGASARTVSLGNAFEKMTGIPATLSIPANKIGWLTGVYNSSRAIWTVAGWDTT